MSVEHDRKGALAGRPVEDAAKRAARRRAAVFDDRAGQPDRLRRRLRPAPSGDQDERCSEGGSDQDRGCSIGCSRFHRRATGCARKRIVSPRLTFRRFSAFGACIGRKPLTSFPNFGGIRDLTNDSVKAAAERAAARRAPAPRRRTEEL
jgi:hypothetical protein